MCYYTHVLKSAQTLYAQRIGIAPVVAELIITIIPSTFVGLDFWTMPFVT
jgi:hypothetical protein